MYTVSRNTEMLLSYYNQVTQKRSNKRLKIRKGIVVDLNENGSHRLIYLNALSPVGRDVVT